MTAILAVAVIGIPPTTQTMTISHYGAFYSTGKHRMSNGKLYSPSGFTCAANRWPLGTKLAIEANGLRLIVVVSDRTAKRFSNRVDLPDGIFAKFYPLSRGIFKARIRRIK